MKNERILNAMGSISDELIEDANIKNLHALPNRKTATDWKHLQTRRIFRLGIAAALIASLLGTVALAARSWFFNDYQPQLSDPAEVVTPTDENGNSQKGTVYQLSFRLPINEEAPELIDRYYFPEVPEMYEQSFGYAYAGLNRDRLVTIHFGWDIPEGEKQGILFEQESAGSLDGNEIRINLLTAPDTVPETKEAVLGGVEGLLITEPRELDLLGLHPHQYFYWSDGNYVFYMRFPIDFTEQQMGQLIGSVKEVDNIQPYLINMTEEELKKTFG